MAKSRKRPAKSNEKSKNLADNDDIDVVPEVEDDGESEESSDDDEMEEEEEEKIDFDFEALPPHESDLEGLVDLITQIFLRVTSINAEDLAKKIIGLSPFGCIFKPTEEYEDDDTGSLVYGVLSMINLLDNDKCVTNVRELLLERATKHADKSVRIELKKMFTKEKNVRLALLINERMVDFPAQIAGPAFKSMIDDFESIPDGERYDRVLVVMKIRVSDPNAPSTSEAMNGADGDSPSTKKKKMGKAEKKRLAAEKLNAADLIFDNPEEELLFQCVQPRPTYFDYPVHSDVEKGSKFNVTVVDGTVYRPFRRVSLLTAEQFKQFAEGVVKAYSP